MAVYVAYSHRVRRAGGDGVLNIMLARLVALPAAAPGFAPVPAPLSHSRPPSADESETREWSGPRDPTYVR
jgi:hypothetical protein